jgi:hypothetical protein
MLLENEKQKIADLEKRNNAEMAAWRESLEPRKQVSVLIAAVNLSRIG